VWHKENCTMLPGGPERLGENRLILSERLNFFRPRRSLTNRARTDGGDRGPE
jgi:hypothetical protein